MPRGRPFFQDPLSENALAFTQVRGSIKAKNARYRRKVDVHWRIKRMQAMQKRKRCSCLTLSFSSSALRLHLRLLPALNWKWISYLYSTAWRGLMATEKFCHWKLFPLLLALDEVGSATFFFFFRKTSPLRRYGIVSSKPTWLLIATILLTLAAGTTIIPIQSLF